MCEGGRGAKISDFETTSFMDALKAVPFARLHQLKNDKDERTRRIFTKCYQFISDCSNLNNST